MGLHEWASLLTPFFLKPRRTQPIQRSLHHMLLTFPQGVLAQISQAIILVPSYGCRHRRSQVPSPNFFCLIIIHVFCYSCIPVFEPYHTHTLIYPRIHTYTNQIPKSHMPSHSHPRTITSVRKRQEVFLPPIDISYSDSSTAAAPDLLILTRNKAAGGSLARNRICARQGIQL